jgi:predicted metalloprotease with PDZ domain
MTRSLQLPGQRARYGEAAPQRCSGRPFANSAKSDSGHRRIIWRSVLCRASLAPGGRKREVCVDWARLAALPFLLAPAANAAPNPAVTYALAPEMQGNAIVALDVTIRLNADRSGTTTLDWVDSWAGEHRLGQWARDIRIEGAASSAPAPNGGRIVHSAPGAPLVMRYRILSAYAADPSVNDSEEARPVIRPGWFYAVGEVLYARPVERDEAPARFAWHGPREIGFASDTEHARGLGNRARRVSDILESIAIGGRDLSVASFSLNGSPVRVAHVGRFGFDIHAFETLARQVIATERGFWHETRPGPFLVTAVPLAPVPGRLSYGGTGRSDAFATWIDRDAELPSLAWLLAHEYFHSWNARQLGRFPEGAEAEAYWLSEGFTDFYARRLMLRAGLWTPEKFVADWNEMLRAYAASPLRATGNAEASTRFWSGDYNAEKIPYQRGAMLAALWDRQLQARHLGDLDTVLRAQRDRTRAARDMPELRSAFIAEIGRAGLDIRPDIDRYLTRGEPIDLPEDAFGSCARVTTADLPVFERGWDTDATARAGNVLTGVDPASNAYAAGLSDGMKILRRLGGEPGNSAVDYVIEVQDGAATRRITFRPAGRRTIRTQQIVLDAARFAAAPAACKAALAG